MRMDPTDLGAPPEEASMAAANLMATVVMEVTVVMEDTVVMEVMVVMEDMDGGIVMKVVRAKKFQLFL